MAIALDTSASATGAGTTLTLAYTVTGSELFGIVEVYDAATLSANVTGVTWNGNAMTEVGTRQTNGGPSHISCWIIKAPTTGNIVVSRTLSAGGSVDLVAASYTGADQTTQPDVTTVSWANHSTGGASVSSSITATTNGCWAVMAGRDNFGTSITPSTNCTQRQETANGAFLYDSNANIGTSSFTQTVTEAGSADISGHQVAIRPSVPAGGSTGKFLSSLGVG